MDTIKKDLEDYVFFLGAPDPEMHAMEKVLKDVGAKYYYLGTLANRNDGSGKADAKRCHSGNAYQCSVAMEPGQPQHLFLYHHEVSSWFDTDPEEGINQIPVFIECRFMTEIDSQFKTQIIDHHRPGDPGFGLPPEKYWAAASIGQLYTFLWEHTSISREAVDDLFGPERFMVAAADHCPSAAMRGLCPGIDTKAMIDMRLRKAAEFNQVDVVEFRRGVDAAIAVIMASPKKTLEGYEYYVTPLDAPMMNHAQLAAGVAIEYRMSPRDANGLVKVGILGGDERLTHAWMKEMSDTQTLVDIYGDPARGYAGGYLDPRP